MLRASQRGAVITVGPGGPSNPKALGGQRPWGPGGLRQGSNWVRVISFPRVASSPPKCREERGQFQKEHFGVGGGQGSGKCGGQQGGGGWLSSPPPSGTIVSGLGTGTARRIPSKVDTDGGASPSSPTAWSGHAGAEPHRPPTPLGSTAPRSPTNPSLPQCLLPICGCGGTRAHGLQGSTERSLMLPPMQSSGLY